MKKALLITLGLIVMLAPACTQQSANNNNANQNPNRNAMQNANNANESGEIIPYQGEKFRPVPLPYAITLEYIITDSVNNLVVAEKCTGCTTAFPEMLSTNANANATLTWKVRYLSISPTAIVHIKDFKDEYGNPANPFDQTPPFDFDSSHTTKDVKPLKGGNYKFTIEVEYGGKTTAIDPRVVFSDGRFVLQNTTVSTAK